jgi:hypothetical protein
MNFRGDLDVILLSKCTGVLFMGYFSFGLADKNEW